MNKDILKAFGNQIRIERNRLGLSQEDFASLVGIHRTYIGVVERGEKNITLKNIQKIATALDIQISQLFIELENIDG